MGKVTTCTWRIYTNWTISIFTQSPLSSSIASMKGSNVVDIIENFSNPSVFVKYWTSWKEPNEWIVTNNMKHIPTCDMDTYMHMFSLSPMWGMWTGQCEGSHGLGHIRLVPSNSPAITCIKTSLIPVSLHILPPNWESPLIYTNIKTGGFYVEALKHMREFDPKKLSW